MTTSTRIAFIGGGNMATAIIDGLLAAGRTPADFFVVEPFEATRQVSVAKGIATTTEPTAGLSECGIWVLATKPQTLQGACEAARPFLKADTVVVSIAAGMRIETIALWLGGHGRVVRTMPNTPAKVGLGLTGMFATAGCSAADKAAAEAVFAATGERMWVATEAMLDPITAITGSGPGYVFYFMEAMERAAVELGFTPDEARKLSVAAFRGAAELAKQDPEPLSTLRERVTSKGGTTYAALSHMWDAKVGETITAALHKASERAAEMAEQLAKPAK
jgi:pyrroline-5-carboxylate reductase